MKMPSTLTIAAIAVGTLGLSTSALAQGTTTTVIVPSPPPTPVAPVLPPVNPLLIGTIGPGTLVGIGLATVIVGTVVGGDSSSDTQ